MELIISISIGFFALLLIFRLIISLFINREYFKKIININLHTIRDIINQLNLSMDESIATGRIDGVLVTIQKDGINKYDNNSFQVILEHNIKLNDTITITRETLLSTVAKNIGLNDFITGFKQFDHFYKIKTTTEYQAAAILTDQARNIIDHTFLNNGKIILSSNKIKFTTTLSTKNDLNLFKENIHQLALLCIEFNRNTNIKNRLIDNIMSCNDPVVVITNLNYLLRNFAYSDDIETLLCILLKTNDPNIVIEAAKHIKKKPAANNALLNTLKTNLSLTEEQTINIIQLLAKNKFSKAVPLLKSMYTHNYVFDVQITVLNAFASFKLTSLEDFLLEQLDRINNQLDLLNPELIPCINALGSCGTIKSVAPLRSIEQKTKSKIIANNCNQAIARIQTHLKNAGQGRLSIKDAGISDGQLSISKDATKGSLSSIKKQKVRKKKQVSTSNG